jgi:2-haloacid dehalogenase
MGPVAAPPLRAQPRTSVKALVFDTFGTVVDWRGSIIAEGLAWSGAIGDAKDSTVDWARFADRWRTGYAPAMERVRTGDLPWTKLDDLHRMILNDLMLEFGMNGLSDAEIDQ